MVILLYDHDLSFWIVGSPSYCDCIISTIDCVRLKPRSKTTFGSAINCYIAINYNSEYLKAKVFNLGNVFFVQAANSEFGKNENKFGEIPEGQSLLGMLLDVRVSWWLIWLSTGWSQPRSQGSILFDKTAHSKSDGQPTFCRPICSD